MKTIFLASALSLLVGHSSSAGAAQNMHGTTLEEVVRKCSGNVAAETMLAVTQFESRGRQYAINVNGRYTLPRQPASQREAIATLEWLTERGFSFDAGLAQLNNRNIKAFGLSPVEVFDPCTNVRAGTKVLSDCYRMAVIDGGESQRSLLKALSCYNTGSLTAGFKNGYVSAVVKVANTTGQAGRKAVLHVPALEGLADHEDKASSGPVVQKKNDGEADAFGDDGEGTPDAFATSGPPKQEFNAKQGDEKGGGGVSGAAAAVDREHREGEAE